MDEYQVMFSLYDNEDDSFVSLLIYLLFIYLFIYLMIYFILLSFPL